MFTPQAAKACFSGCVVSGAEPLPYVKKIPNFRFCLPGATSPVACDGGFSASQVAQLYGTDSVGDGIPNWWRLQYFGNSSATDAVTCAVDCGSAVNRRSKAMLD